MRREVERVRFFKGDDVILLNSYEKLPEGAELLKQFFWIFSCHDPWGIVASKYREGAFFYCCDLPSPSRLKEKFNIEIVDLHLPEEMEIPSVFYDIRTNEDIRIVDLFSIPSQTINYFYLRDRRVGIYFQKNHLLIASDWTHNSECVQVLRHLLPQICKFFKKRSFRAPRINFQLTLGADPEFELVNARTRKVVSAQDVVRGGTLSSHEIGVDGAGWQVEVRPAPSASVNKFVKNIRDILVRFAQEYPGYSLSVQGDKFPLGGHIHLSVPPNNDIITLLDHWVGEYVINLSGAARGSYKKMSAIETKRWGFEYRTPPAAIFLSPRVLRAVLKIIKSVISAYYKRDGVALRPCDEEIRRLGIDRHWKVLQDFISQYPSLDKDVMRGWRIKVSQVNKIDLVFRDDWNDQVMSYVKELFFKKLDKRMMKKLNKRGINKLLFFGLRKERGDVCNFPTSLFSEIDYRYSIDNGLAFGFPWCVRMPDGMTDDLKGQWHILIDDVISELKRKVR